MSNSFSALKNNKSKEFDKLNDQLQKMNNNGPSGDDRYWKLEVDKADNGFAEIRFLPAPPGEDSPFERMWDHGFQGPGGWYIENSLTTIQKDDPVSEHNGKLWNSGTDENKDIARKQKRRLSFHANIYVVKDPANPSNEGKVFLYKFGKKIFDKLNDAMNPEFDDEEALNPFDFWTGANFKLKARNVEGWRNYDKSEFSSPGVLKKPDGTEMTDEELEEIWNSEHSIKEIVDPKNFKSYDELKAKLYKVLQLDGGDPAPTNTAEDSDGEMDFTPNFKEQSQKTGDETSSPAMDEDEDDAEAFFKGLADD